MLTILMEGKKRGEHFGINFPTTMEQVKKELERAKLIKLKGKEFYHIVGAVVPEEGLKWYLTDKTIHLPEDTEKLNDLATKIDAMSEQDAVKFVGALDNESINTLDDVIRIAGSLQDYTLFSEIHTEQELGEYLVAHGYLSVPEHLRGYINYHSIATGYRCDHGGVFTYKGLVLRNTAIDPCMLEHDEGHPVFRVTLWNREMYDNGGKPYQMSFPTSMEAIGEAAVALKVDNLDEVAAFEVECMDHRLDQLLHFPTVDALVLNEVAKGIQNLAESDDFEKLLAVLEVEQPQSMGPVLRILGKMDDYEIIAGNYHDYGTDSLRRVIMDNEIADEVIAQINGFMDWREYGKLMMDEDGVKTTEHGAVRRISEPWPDDMEQRREAQTQAM